MSTITLPPKCDRAAAEQILPELVDLVGKGPVAIDGKAVTQIGQAMLQLLLSARRSSDRVTISASGTLRDAAATIGLSDALLDGNGL